MIQDITVYTKGQLLAAFECTACDDPDTILKTIITLVRKSGKTVWHLESLRTLGTQEEGGKHTLKYATNLKLIRRIKKEIQKIPERVLLS